MTRSILCISLVIATIAATAECLTPPIKRELKYSRSVFVGRMVLSSSAGITFEVVEPFKGAVRGQRIAAYPDLGFDGYDPRSLTAGSLHLVFARFDGEHLIFGRCSNGSRFEASDAKIRLLRRRAWWWRLPLSGRPWR